MSDPTDPARAEILPGAEPLSIDGDETGVLVVHGFTGNPQSMRGLATAFGDAGFTVELPLLPGHGTELAQMLATDWADWSAAVESAYQDLAARTERVVVAGLSMGGTLTLWLAEQHPEITGIVLVNPACPVPGENEENTAALQALLDAGEQLMDGIGSDIADPDASELAYGQTPIAPLLSLLLAGEEVSRSIGEITCPAVLFSSPLDHVVDPAHSDHLAAHYGGPLERVSLDRSYHVATLDYDKDLIAERSVAFVQGLLAPA